MPRANSSVVHPAFATSPRGLGPMLSPRSVTIEEPVGARDTLGQPADTWSAVDDLEDLPAVVGPESSGREARRSGDTIYVGTHVIVLGGYYPEITTAHRAVVDGTEVHDIVEVEHSSTLTLTRLGTRIVS